MPRLRRVPRIRHGWPRGAVHHLLTGHDFFGDGFGRGDLFEAFDRQSAETAWFELRGRVFALLAEYRRQTPDYPLLRPVAWWWFESPEERDHEISEAEQLHRLGFSYVEGEVPIREQKDTESKVFRQTR